MKIICFISTTWLHLLSFSSLLFFYNYSFADDKLKEISKQTPCKVLESDICIAVDVYKFISALSLKIQYMYILYIAFPSRAQYGYFLELHIKRSKLYCKRCQSVVKNALIFLWGEERGGGGGGAVHNSHSMHFKNRIKSVLLVCRWYLIAITTDMQAGA